MDGDLVEIHLSEWPLVAIASQYRVVRLSLAHLTETTVARPRPRPRHPKTVSRLSWGKTLSQDLTSLLAIM